MPNYPWERPTMDGFLREAEEKFSNLFNLDIAQITDAIQSACAFFGLSYPNMVLNLSRQPKGGTMVYNLDPETDADDILCYDLNQLMALGITNKDSFSLIMTHECAHRYFQGYDFPGLNNGQWEQELACDFCMGARAALEHMNIEKVVRGLGRTQGADTHPDGDLRAEAITGGYDVMLYFLKNNIAPTVANCIRGFNDFRATYEPTIFAREQRYLKK